MPRSNLNIGITGAEGTVGTLLRRDLAKDHRLRLFTLEPQEFSHAAIDLAEEEELKGAFEGLDAVIHLAASVNTLSPWDQVLRNNIVATRNVFEECVRSRVKRIVFASTCHTQHGLHMEGNEPGVTRADIDFRTRLDDPPLADSYYGVSKLFGEDLGAYLSRIHGLQFIALRIGAIGKNDDPQRATGKRTAKHFLALYLSHRDCVGYFKAALASEAERLVAYAISNNQRHGIFDLTETVDRLGYQPQDSTDPYG